MGRETWQSRQEASQIVLAHKRAFEFILSRSSFHDDVMSKMRACLLVPFVACLGPPDELHVHSNNNSSHITTEKKTCPLVDCQVVLAATLFYELSTSGILVPGTYSP